MDRPQCASRSHATPLVRYRRGSGPFRSRPTRSAAGLQGVCGCRTTTRAASGVAGGWAATKCGGVGGGDGVTARTGGVFERRARARQRRIRGGAVSAGRKAGRHTARPETSRSHPRCADRSCREGQPPPPGGAYERRAEQSDLACAGRPRLHLGGTARQKRSRTLPRDPAPSGLRLSSGATGEGAAGCVAKSGGDILQIMLQRPLNSKANKGHRQMGSDSEPKAPLRADEGPKTTGGHAAQTPAGHALSRPARYSAVAVSHAP